MQHPESNELFAFYNVENLFSPDPPPVHKLDPTLSGLSNWDQRKYDNKLFKITQVFQLMQEKYEVLPMLIGLSEIQGQSPLDELVKMPPFNSEYDVVHYDSLDERGVDVALLFNKSKLELISAEPLTYFFEVTENTPSYYDTTRDVLLCKMRYAGEIINVFVLHLPSKRGDDVNRSKRIFMLKDIREKVQVLLNEKKEAVVLCGDFNDNPDEDYLNDLLYDDQSKQILKNPSLDLYRNNNFSTFHRNDGLLFDQMMMSYEFFNSNFPLQFKSAEVFSPPPLRSWDKKFEGRPFRTYAGTRYLGGYSDHFPIVVEWYKK